MPEFPDGLEDLQRRIRVSRALHVDADEKATMFGGFQNLPQVVYAHRAVDVEAKLRQLERQVPLDAGPVDRFDQVEILPSRGIGFRECRDAFAEVVQRAQKSL